MFVSVITRFLSGYFFAPMNVPGIPDIPGFGDIKDAFVDGIGEAFDQMVDAIVGSVNDKYLWLLESTIRLIGNIGMPPAEMFQEGPVSILLGGTYGLSVNIMRFILIVSALILLIMTARQRRSEIGGRVLTSLFGLVLFSFLFFPLYGFLDSLARTGAESAIELISQSAGGDELSDLVVPDDLFGAFLTAGIGTIIMFFVLIEAAGMWIGTILVAVWYPMSVALRPFGRFGLVQFNVCTALLFTIPLSLIMMSFALAFGVFAVNLVESTTAIEAVPGATTMISVICTIVGGLAAAYIPYALFKAAYAKSSQVFGNVESRLQSGIDVHSMPTVSTKQAQEDQSRKRLALLSFVGGAASHAVLSDRPTGQEMKTQVLDRVSMAAKAAPDPRVRAASWAYDFTRQYAQKRKSSKGGEGS